MPQVLFAIYVSLPVLDCPQAYLAPLLPSILATHPVHSSGPEYVGLALVPTLSLVERLAPFLTNVDSIASTIADKLQPHAAHHVVTFYAMRVIEALTLQQVRDCLRMGVGGSTGACSCCSSCSSCSSCP